MARPTDETLKLRAARAYLFRVLLSGKPFTLDGVPGMRDGLFVLPRNPVSVQYQSGARTFTYVTGYNEKRSDAQGVDPPVITLALDFGERGAYDAQSRQGMDGRQSMRAAEALVRVYLEQTAKRGRARQPLPIMEFHDVYRGEAWVVMPQLVPYGAEDSGRPYAESSTLRLEALSRADEPIPAADALPSGLRDKYASCPLNPGCKYGGPRTSSCPFRSTT